MLDEQSRVYKVFISNIEQDNEEYDLFIEKLSASPDFKWDDYAIRGKFLPEELKVQIEPVEVVIILSDHYSKNTKLIKSQIDTAIFLKKPIVVLRPYGMEVVPFNLEEIATEVIGWNTFCIIDSIRNALGEGFIDE